MNDERYRPRPQSLQAELPGLGARGEEVMAEARAWAEENPGAWEYMLDNAERLASRGYVSANYLVHMVRNELRVPVPNSCSPAFARMAAEQRPRLRGAFRTHASMTDGFGG
ncbi:hypothetical protein JI75_02425 [Berryella intestinalis]|uniref:Uncharacterized protein n=1 Tax=Berryella intestinalis TaxID=1531429 RepID=A0A0A8B2W0_9ACTN|nr:hypothetical protein [Berryella intestinalis]AJC11699.1 hypothetical protein JI75_02425 [Berryella intestinalis]